MVPRLLLTALEWLEEGRRVVACSDRSVMPTEPEPAGAAARTAA